ncbi:dehalogenase [Dehalococcoides mccartyi CG1]|uniref:hypothetical protein n=1 Tax=Dehalococcoides mccartyi TaxID=61435 RepID=UPI0004E07B49|nr:hypothetical protein [Dehalococcoides mccartyi]AII58455.1 dehalogenase [Dehalococcoides mccartyi CG1]
MWFIFGLVLGLVVLGFVWLVVAKKLTFTWYEWLIGIVGLALLTFTLQNFFGSFSEMEPQAAWMFLLITGLPSLVLLAVAWQLSARRMKKA